MGFNSGMTRKDVDKVDADDMGQRDKCGRQFCIRVSSPYLEAWDKLLCLLLVYYGTVFPYTLCFLEYYAASEEGGSKLYGSGGAPWRRIEAAINMFFWVDLILPFFCTYRNAHQEIFDPRAIALHYLKGYFFLNLIACLPSSVFAAIYRAIAHRNTSSMNQVTRLCRIPRLVRLLRLESLATHFVSPRMTAALEDSATVRWLQSMRVVRIVKLVASLTWVVHIIACGWYLVAALHEDPSVTWLGRRELPPDNRALWHEDPGIQWLNSMYFVMTVFTTVGFGDMSALTNAEIVYIILMMLVGAVVNGIVVSEVINVITTRDQKSVEIEHQRRMIHSFASHSQIGDNLLQKIDEWIMCDRHKEGLQDYDKDEVSRLLVDGGLPRDLIKQVPSALYSGKFVKNRFVSTHLVPVVAARQVLKLALTASFRYFTVGEIVFFACDSALNMFLVFSGTFSYAAKTNSDNDNHTCRADAKLSADALAPYQLFSCGSCFGELDLVMQDRMRAATARSEVTKSCVLVLSGEEIDLLRSASPMFCSLMWVTACRREASRRSALRRIRGGYRFDDLAAYNIQRKWSQIKRGSACTTRGEVALDTPYRKTVRKAGVATQDTLTDLSRELDKLQESVTAMQLEFEKDL